MDQIEYPMEQPDYNNNSRGLFTGSGIYGPKPTHSDQFRPRIGFHHGAVHESLVSGSFTARRLLSGTKPNSFYLKTHESETLVKNQQFILNAGSKVTDIAWIKGMIHYQIQFKGTVPSEKLSLSTW